MSAAEPGRPVEERPGAAGRVVALGGGLVVPYPEPVDEAATNVGKGNRGRDTKPEVRLRSTLHRRGVRFRKDHLVRAGAVTVRADIAFTRIRLAVFVDGCFWHGCASHRTIPRRNVDYWVPKLRSNVERDQRVNAALSLAGWDVFRVWEHEDLEEAARLIEERLSRPAPRLAGPETKSFREALKPVGP